MFQEYSPDVMSWVQLNLNRLMFGTYFSALATADIWIPSKLYSTISMPTAYITLNNSRTYTQIDNATEDGIYKFKQVLGIYSFVTLS